MQPQKIPGVLLSKCLGLLGALSPSPSASDSQSAGEPGPDSNLPPLARVSLLSVVRQRNGTRYMAVEQIEDGWADCAWFEYGTRRTHRFPVSELEVVPALGADDALWRAAFRAANHRKIG